MKAKSGMLPDNVKDFLNYCLHEIILNVIGKMVFHQTMVKKTIF